MSGTQYISDRGAAAWGGTLNHTPTEFSIQINGPEQDITAMGSTVSHRSKRVGMLDWTATTTAFTTTPTMGSKGLITASGFSVAFARQWEMAIRCEEHDSTYFSGTPTYRSFIPGLLSASGNFECDLESGTALTAAGTTATGTFQLTSTATAQTIAATIYQLSVQSTQKVGEKVMATYGFVTSGNITLAGTGDFTAILGTGTLAVPTAQTLTLTSTTSRTYVGSAFWTGVTIRCAVDDLISITTTFRGTGALTIN